MWRVEFTNEFEEWWNGLSQEQQERIDVAIEHLEEKGPGLGRPLVDTIEGSKVPNLKELRVGTIRILFVFDPRRTAILLLGENKSERWAECYEEAIPEAERLYEEYLSELRKEGLIE